MIPNLRIFNMANMSFNVIRDIKILARFPNFRGCLRFVIVVFPDLTHLLFFTVIFWRNIAITF